MNKILENEADTLAFGEQLARVTPDGAVIFLEGTLGAGKTTLVRGFLRGLGYRDKVKSPTYTIVEPYEIEHRTVFHFDFYRIQDPQELTLLGLADYFLPTSICLIEWPDKGAPYLPAPDVICRLAITEDKRLITLQAESDCGKVLVSAL